MDETKQIILNAKFARIIKLLSKHFDNSLEKAVDVFYNSDTAQLIQDGVADLHCRSDQYLADEIYAEYAENQSAFDASLPRK